MTRATARSYERINKADLRKLAEIARLQREAFFSKPRPATPYKRRFLCSALCQGAALHYVDKKNGVKDFDIFQFFAKLPNLDVPYRARWMYDFGPSKFGRWGKERRGYFEGRHVDVMMRTLAVRPSADPIEAVTGYLDEGKTPTAGFLAQKAVVLLEPVHLLGSVVWRPHG